MKRPAPGIGILFRSLLPAGCGAAPAPTEVAAGPALALPPAGIPTPTPTPRGMPALTREPAQQEPTATPFPGAGATSPAARLNLARDGPVPGQIGEGGRLDEEQLATGWRP